MNHTSFHFIRSACHVPGLALGMVLAGVALLSAEEKKPEPPQPQRQELWVPSTDLDAILKKHPNAVLLDRAQYEALLRDAGRVKAVEGKPSVPCAVQGVKLRVDLASGSQTAAITAKLTVHGLVDTWSEVKLLDLPPGVVLTQFDGDNVSPASDAKNNRVLRLLVRGKGKHEITMQFRSPVSRTKGVSHALVPYLARPFTITAAATDGVVLPSTWATKDGVTEVPLFDGRMAAVGTTFYWLERANQVTPSSTLMQRVDSLVNLQANEIETYHRVTVESSQGPLPAQLRFQLGDPAVQVTRVGWWGKGDPPVTRGSEGSPVLGGDQEVASWKQDGTVLELTRRDSFATQADLYFVTTKPSPLVAQTHALPLDVPKLTGAARIRLNVALRFHEGLEMVGWQTPGLPSPPEFLNFEKAQRNASQTDAASFMNSYQSIPDQVVVNIRRTADLYSADVDLYALVTQHDLQIKRMIAFRGEEGGVRRAVFSLPAGEQFLNLTFSSGESIKWKQTEGATPSIEVNWPKALEKGQTTSLQLSTRKELPTGADAAAANAAPAALAVQNLAIPEATRLAGYLALDFDESWKVATPEVTGLETRDARYAPVKGRMAWFYLRDFRLGIEISRHEPVLDAAIAAYALPRNRTVEIEGQVSVEVTRAPLRTFSVKLPTSVASLMRWDSPLIGERTLDAATGVWTLKLRKELMGVANLRWHLSQPGETQAPAAEGAEQGAEAGDQKKTVLTALLPRIEFPTARRLTGAWIIEANTDTELNFTTKGVQPLDATRAPPVEGYTPHHRVLAAYGYGSAPHELRVTATRHESTRLTSAIVETLTLTSVLARDGTARHEAVARVRHSGDQFFAIRLPAGATLLTTSVEHKAIKPVTAGPGEVRVPLPRQQAGNNLALVTVLYDTAGKEWGGGGRSALQPPTFDEAVPVLATTWRVHAPAGYSYIEPDTTLVNRQPGRATPPLTHLAAKAASRVLPQMDVFGSLSQAEFKAVEGIEFAHTPPGGVPFVTDDASVRAQQDNELRWLERKNAIRESLEGHIVPEVKLNGASVEDAIEYLRIRSGVRHNLTIKPGAAPSTARITLDLKNVPYLEALRYITELGGMMYEITPTGVVVKPITDLSSQKYTRTYKVPSNFLELGVDQKGTPRDPFAPTPDPQTTSGAPTAMGVLKSHGIPFPEGAWANYLPQSSTLVVHNTMPNLDAVEILVEEWLPGTRQGEAQMDRDAESKRFTASIADRMNRIIFPEVKFQGASVEEAIEFLRIKSRDYDTNESDPAKRGLTVILKPGSAPSTALITLDLKDVPLSEALKYVTELGGMKYKIEPYAIVIVPISDLSTEQYTRTFKVPPDFLSHALSFDNRAPSAPQDPFAPDAQQLRGIAARPDAKSILMAQGIPFPEGASASFVPATGQLIVKGAQPNLDAVENLVEEAWKGYSDRSPVEGKSKAGVLPVKLELPATGRIFEFSGNQKPGELMLRYQSWERQMGKACFWLMVGLALFVRWGRKRSCWRTLGAVLLLTCVPLALLPEWLAMCNALLAGWLLGLVIWLLHGAARWVEQKAAERRAFA